MAIEIMPGTSPKVISLKGTSLIRVAIPSRSGFHPVQQVDRASVTFGRTGEEHSLDSCAADGANLVCQFKTTLTGFRPGGTQGIIRLVSVSTSHDYSTGRDLTWRTRLEGRGTVQIVP